MRPVSRVVRFAVTGAMLLVLTGCAQLPVSGLYCVFVKPGSNQIGPIPSTYSTPCAGSVEYDATARIGEEWQIYSLQDIAPNNPNSPLFLQGFGPSPRVLPSVPGGPVLLHFSGQLGGTIIVNGYTSYSDALTYIDDMFVLDFKKQVAANAIQVISQKSSDPALLKQTRKVIMDVVLKDGTVSRVTTSTMLYGMSIIREGVPVKMYILKSMTIGCETACYEANTVTIDKALDSWENG